MGGLFTKIKYVLLCFKASGLCTFHLSGTTDISLMAMMGEEPSTVESLAEASVTGKGESSALFMAHRVALETNE